MHQVMVKIFILVMVALLAMPNAYIARAAEIEDKAREVLVVYSSKDNKVDEHQRMLDMLLGHFTNDIQFIPSAKVQEEDLNKVDFLFYYGEQKEILPHSFTELVEKYSGVMVAIGYNTEQFGERFSFINRDPQDTVIDEIISKNESEHRYQFASQYMLNITGADIAESEVILSGKKGTESSPLFIRNGNNYYFASRVLKPPFSIGFSEGLHEVFSSEQSTDSRLGYIRLEDVHPLVDPKNMMEIAKVLKEKEIPYMIAVIPVYTNPETQKQYHLADSPELLKVLKYMQSNGASIVLHGYTHQFRLSETGEGFEFWDVEHNMPIYHGPEDEVIKKTREDFTNEYDYKQFVKGQKEYEKNYIEERLTRGIEELANYGLYPLAFEAPHYTMSQYGYEVSAEFFSTYVGQVQMSDKNWMVMTTSPYITQPNFLGGMTLLPETIGYVHPDDPQAVDQIMNKVNDYQFVRNGMIAGFYHPYLGLGTFLELIEELEKVPNVEWIDLKQMNNYVRTENVDIKSANGEIEVMINRTGLFKSSIDYLNYHIKRITKVVLWCVAMVGLLVTLNFIVHIYINHRRKNRGESLG